MIKIKKLTAFLVITFLIILISFPLYLTANKAVKTAVFHFYLIPIIFTAFRFGFKGAVLVTLISTLIYAPDYMLFWGKVNEEIIEAYIQIIIFTLIALFFGFFLDKWRSERNKLAQTNALLLEMNEDLKEMLILKEALEKQERLAALGTVSSGISHELKNPLSIIKTAISTFTPEALENKEIMEVKSVIEEEIDRANSIINSVLSIAREGDIIFERFTFSKMLMGVLRLLKENLNKKKCDIISEIESKTEIFGDEQKLSRVVFNLLLNAADAVEESGGGWIKIRLVHNETHLTFSVEDSGGGIQAKNIDMVFAPFYTTKNKGTGLGLPIAKKIIDEHNGSIECENTAAGALFTVQIPLEKKEE